MIRSQICLIVSKIKGSASKISMRRISIIIGSDDTRGGMEPMGWISNLTCYTDSSPIMKHVEHETAVYPHSIYTFFGVTLVLVCAIFRFIHIKRIWFSCILEPSSRYSRDFCSAKHDPTAQQVGDCRRDRLLSSTAVYNENDHSVFLSP